MKKQRIIIVERSNLFEACLENLDDKKVLCKGTGDNPAEAIGRLVINHSGQLGLYEVIKIDPAL